MNWEKIPPTINDLISGVQTLWSSQKTADEIQNVQSNINSHVSDKNNPHHVTVEQIGAETPAGAQTKTDTAKTAAINTAAADATTKVDSHAAALVAHSWGQISGKPTTLSDYGIEFQVDSKDQAIKVAANLYTDGAISYLVNSAPDALNTLCELAAAIGNDPNFSTTITALIGMKETPAGAQIKADAAKTTAISVAASDATTKTNAVQTNLNAHTANVTDAHNITNRLESVRSYLIDYIEQSIAAIVNGSPEMLDTLFELANALGNDPNFAATMTNLIGQKLAASEVVTTATDNKVLRLDSNGKFPASIIAQSAGYRFTTDTQATNWDTVSNKVDKIAGKQLSTEDYTSAEKTKLAGVAASANNYTHPTTAGSKHIPAGGAAGQLLEYGGSSGTATWGTYLSTLVTQDQLATAGSGDMLKSVYDADDDGKVDVAKTAESVLWGGVIGKPSTMEPIAHASAATTYGVSSATNYGHAKATAVIPVADGTADVGTDNGLYARGDHRHPVDSTRAPLASPALTGTPIAPTAAAGTNTTQIANTAFVSTAVVNLVASSLGNDLNFATTMTNALAGKQPLDATLTALAALVTAADKLVYATGSDTFTTTTLTAFARTLLDDANAATALATLGAAPLASPALTGTPTAPTAAAGTNTTQLATTAFANYASNGVLTKSVAGGSTVTLTAAEAAAATLVFTGALTANIAVIVPAVAGQWSIKNSTTGAFTLTVKTASGSGVIINQGFAWVVYCDGTNVVDAITDFKDIPLTGIPTAPTASSATSTTQIATTAFVHSLTDSVQGEGVTGLTNYIAEGLTIAPDTGLNVSINPGRSNISEKVVQLITTGSLGLNPRMSALIYQNKDGGVGKVNAVSPLSFIDNNTVALWIFNQTAVGASAPNTAVGISSIAVANNLVPVGGLVSVDGWNDYAIRGDGSGYYTSANSTGFPTGAAEREYNLLFMVGNINTTRDICTYGTTASPFGIRITNARVGIYGTTTYDTGFDVVSGGVYLISYGYDGASLVIKINGIQIYTAAVTLATVASVLKVLCTFDNSLKSSDTIQFLELRNKMRTPAQCGAKANNLCLPCEYIGYTAAYPTIPAADVTTAYHEFKFDETSGTSVADSAGTLNGTATSTSIVDSEIGLGKARRTNGTNSDYITFGNYAFTGDFTFIWVGNIAALGAVQSLISNRNSAVTTGNIICINASGGLQISSPTLGVSSFSICSPGKPVFLAMTSKALLTHTFYVDSPYIDTVQTLPLHNASGILVAAKDGSNNQYALKANHEYILLIPRALTQAEITPIYNKLMSQEKRDIITDAIPIDAISLGFTRTDSSKVIEIDSSSYKYGRREKAFNGNRKVFLGWKYFSGTTILSWKNPFGSRKIKVYFVYAQDANGTNETVTQPQFYLNSSSYGILYDIRSTGDIFIATQSTGVAVLNGVWQTSGYIGLYCEVIS